MAEETWRPVPGFESNYICSNLGRVARLMGGINTGGYMTMSLPRKVEGYGCSLGSRSKPKKWGDRPGYRVYIHHVIALTFIGRPHKNKPMINHIDGNKKNNNASNLEWCNAQHNIRHAIKLNPRKKRGPNLTDDQITWIREQYKTGRSMNSIAKELKIRPTSVGYWVRLTRLGQRNG